LPSSQAEDSRQPQLAPAFVQVYVTPPQLIVWQALPDPHVTLVPAEHVPVAPFSPQPPHV